MSRPLRIEYAEAVYHVTSRGNARRSIFKDDKDRWMLLNILEEVNDRYHWFCHAYCLMDNHVIWLSRHRMEIFQKGCAS